MLYPFGKDRCKRKWLEIKRKILIIIGVILIIILVSAIIMIIRGVQTPKTDDSFNSLDHGYIEESTTNIDDFQIDQVYLTDTGREIHYSVYIPDNIEELEFVSLFINRTTTFCSFNISLNIWSKLHIIVDFPQL